MNPEQRSLIALSPFVRQFTFQVIASIQNKKIYLEERNCIHADLIPKFSEQVIQRSMKAKTLSPESFEFPKEIKPPIRPLHHNFHRRPFPVYRQIAAPMAPQIAPQAPFAPQTLVGGYGKIDPILNDPSVSMIECLGPGKELALVRVGQRQFTRIILSNEEIRELLEEIAHRAKIPLIEGVFRAAVDNFSISAIVSDMVGSKFLIKKQFLFSNAFPVG